jgi:hypothetical protein
MAVSDIIIDRIRENLDYVQNAGFTAGLYPCVLRFLSQ